MFRLCIVVAFLYGSITCLAFVGMKEKSRGDRMKCPHLKMKAEYRCPYSKYQTADGTCNNIINTYSGSTGVPLRRILPAQYGDGIQAPRRARDGGELPNSRLISNAFSSAGVEQVSSDIFAHMFVQMGQFLAHDSANTPNTKEKDGSDISCDCMSTRPECLIIPIPEGDYYNGIRECITIVRSAPVKGTNCAGSPRQQFNSITAYWDGNTVYGSDDVLMNALRDPESESGELLVIKDDTSSEETPETDSLPLLGQMPEVKHGMFACPKHLHANKSSCFAAGEGRVNENQGLISTHMVFMREHNRIARQLKEINPHWTSNKTFWETRRILGAITKKLTYSEFLPALVGEKNMRTYDLITQNYGYYYGYDATYDASISNVWTTAAFRYGHSMIKQTGSHLDSEYEPEMEPVPMHEMLFNPSPLQDRSVQLDALLVRGMLEDAAEKADTFMNEELRSKMFQSETKIGVDLFSINIERGREHGLPGYNDYRVFCGMRKALTFNDLASEIPEEKLNIISSLYKHVNDIDIFIGGLAETNIEGAAVGPTFACLNAEQFRAMKKGDKSWYENPEVFTYEQLQEIRKITISSIICSNVAGMKTIQPNAMLLDSVPGNAKISCDEIPKMDFGAWKNPSTKHVTGVLTRWFSKSDRETGQRVLQRESARHGDQICAGPMNYIKESFEKHGVLQHRIRFTCPQGSLASSDFPKHVKGYTWTVWLDRDSPSSSKGSDDESLARHILERPRDLCKEPLLMQARTTQLKMGFETGETFEFFGPSHGLVCKSKHQPTKSGCSDYSVRFLCPNDFFENERKNYETVVNSPGVMWTPWMSHDDQDGKGDFESPALSRFIGRRVCRQPLLIEAQIVGTNISHKETNDVLKRLHPVLGLQCLNADQPNGICHSYEVRYLCPKKY